jgi:hypothetical protein
MRTAFLFLAVTLIASPNLPAQHQPLADLKDFSVLGVRCGGFQTDRDQEIIIRTVNKESHSSTLQAKVWILNSDSRECLWDSRKERSVSLPVDEERSFSIQLPKGTYEVYGVIFPESENMHNFEDFIDLLGKKLFHWGRGDRAASKDFQVLVEGDGTPFGDDAVIEIQNAKQKDALVSFMRVGDDERLRQGFHIAEQCSLDIYAVGEMTGEDAVDYGGIQNVETGEIVWSMQQAHTTPAGGSKKNRMVKDRIALAPGNYAAFYITDDSHSYEEWNAAPPNDPAFWGMTIRVAESAKKNSAQKTDHSTLFSHTTIVSLTRLKDDAGETKGFSLKQPLDVRIYAIGEGVNGEMTDYGWILNHTTRQKVWTMEYDETAHAGGAEKNRMVNKVIHLEKGDYTVHFVTDGSHSYNRWNAAPPSDPEHWGITLSAADPSFAQTMLAPYSEENDPRYLVRIIGVRDNEQREQEFTLKKKQQISIYALGESDGDELTDFGWIEDARGNVVWKMKDRDTERAGGAKKNRLFDGTITLQPGTYVAHYETDGSHAFGDWNDTPPDDPMHWGITITLSEE